MLTIMTGGGSMTLYIDTKQIVASLCFYFSLNSVIGLFRVSSSSRWTLNIPLILHVGSKLIHIDARFEVFGILIKQ
jgi:hypothetical protein